MHDIDNSTGTISDAERIEQLLEANAALEAELALERQQLASAQQRLASMSQQLSNLSNQGTEPMMPIGEHHFDVSKIAALTWDHSKPEQPTICVDGVTVWQPARSRPMLLTTMEISDEMRAQLPARIEAWEAERQAAMQEILGQINAAKSELASRRKRRR